MLTAEPAQTARKSSLSVLAADDDADFLELLGRLLQNEGYVVQTVEDGLAAINLLQTNVFDLVLLDIEMPKVNGVDVLKFVRGQGVDTEVIMLTGIEDLKTAIQCMKAGAFNYITKPYSTDELLSVIDRAVERKRLLRQNKGYRMELARHALPLHIIGQSKPFLDVMNVALRAAPTESPVLIEGANGTGKELIANFIHTNSLRGSAPILAINCSSLPLTLIESELFGHEKGAFTDAKMTKQGLVEIANGGTLFLDEIGELPLVVQPKLLRFLQTGDFRRIGGNKVLRADVRVISATNADLRRKMSEGGFREDLYYRLSVIVLSVPPLRDRREDIPLLADNFVRTSAGLKTTKSIDKRALEALTKYGWPGNVRELRNVIERAVILSHDDTIRLEDLALPGPATRLPEAQSDLASASIVAGSAISLADMQKAHVEGVLRSVHGNKELAAKILGISVKTLYTKMQAYGFPRSK